MGKSTQHSSCAGCTRLDHAVVGGEELALGGARTGSSIGATTCRLAGVAAEERSASPRQSGAGWAGGKDEGPVRLVGLPRECSMAAGYSRWASAGR